MRCAAARPNNCGGETWTSNCVWHGFTLAQLAELELEVLLVIEREGAGILEGLGGHQRAGIGGTVGRERRQCG